MRLYSAIAICLACSLVIGCQEQTQSQTNENLDVELVKTINNVGVENAIITQHTLYPYHFVTDGERLNDLGQRDFAVLARHFTEHPGTLNIRRAETSAELYDARVAYVLGRLKEAGVETSRVSVSDGMPGGSGMPSERVVTILQKESVPTRMTTGSASREMITR
jgi:hypothetical protein